MPPISWSYSALEDFECPKRYYLKRVSKEIPYVETEEQRWGNLVHKALEDRLIEKKPLPEHTSWMENFICKLEAQPGEKFAEGTGGKMTINANLEETSWFSKDAWCRAIVDVGVKHNDTVWMGDYKTGKRRPGSPQLSLSAALKFAIDPEVMTIKTSYIWLKTKQMDSGGTFHRDEARAIWEQFLPRVKRLELAYEKNAWPAKPSALCPWCPATKAQCTFKK